MMNPNLPKPTKEMWGHCVSRLMRLEQTILENRMHSFVMSALEHDMKLLKKGLNNAKAPN